MLGRVLTALTVAAAITSAASAQDVKWPAIEFGRYHALVIAFVELTKQYISRLVSTPCQYFFVRPAAPRKDAP